MKLKNILRESKKEQMMRRMTREEKSGIMDSVARFNDFGSKIYKTDEIKEMVRAIKEMASGAANLALQETDDWFDSVTVKRDMKEVANSVKLFEKTAHEMSQMQQRLESVYEDMGHKLSKYYDIHDVVDKGDMDGDGVDEPDDEEYMDNRDKAIKKAMNEKDKGDMDGDGIDEPDEEEYLDNKDKAIKKAMKMETIMNEGASEEEKRIAMNGVRRQAKYRQVDVATAIQDQIRALKDLAREQAKKDKAKKGRR